DRPLLPLAVEVADGCGEVGAEGAAYASAREHHGGLVDVPQQQVIEADLSELVDQHGGIGELGGREQPLQQRGLAAAEEARNDVDGDEIGGSHDGRARYSRSTAAISAGSSGSQRRPAIRSATGHNATRCWTIADRPVQVRRT